MLVFCSFLFVIFPFEVLKIPATKRLESLAVTPPFQAADELPPSRYSSTTAAIPRSSTRLSGSTLKKVAKAFWYFGKTGILPVSIWERQQLGIFTSKLSWYWEIPALSRKERSFVFFIACTSLFFLNICKRFFTKKWTGSFPSKIRTQKKREPCCLGSRLWCHSIFAILL